MMLMEMMLMEMLMRMMVMMMEMLPSFLGNYHDSDFIEMKRNTL